VKPKPHQKEIGEHLERVKNAGLAAGHAWQLLAAAHLQHHTTPPQPATRNPRPLPSVFRRRQPFLGPPGVLAGWTG
jgi:hypothetical protein